MRAGYVKTEIHNKVMGVNKDTHPLWWDKDTDTIYLKCRDHYTIVATFGATNSGLIGYHTKSNSEDLVPFHGSITIHSELR